MFTIVLMRKSDSVPLKKVYASENDYLTKEEKEDTSSYPLLSEVSSVDICVFSSEDMSNLIKELEILKTTLSNNQYRHIDEIIKLARACEQNSEYILGFTPFATFLNDMESKTISSNEIGG